MPRAMQSPCKLSIICLFAIIMHVANAAPTNYSFADQNLRSNMLVTSKYALVGQNSQPQPTLKKLDFQAMKLKTILYDPVDDWLNLDPAIIVDFKNGQIAYSQGFQVFILNNETLQLKQTLGDRFSPIESVGDLQVFIDPKTNQSIYLVGRDGYGHLYSEIKKNDQGKYQSTYKFATPSSQGFRLFLTGLNRAVSTTGCDLTYWTNFNSIVDRQTDMKYFMKGRKFVAVSYDETFFVLKNDTGFYEIYNLDERYDVQLKSSIFVSYNDYRKGEMTDDDKYLFLAMSNPRDKHNVVKVDVAKGEYTLVIDTDGSSDNHFDFTLLTSKYDRFLSLAVRNKAYFLQLRSVSTMQLFHELPLSFGFSVLEYKLIGSTEWGLTFALGVRTLPYAYDLEKDSKIFLYSAEGDKIGMLNAVAPVDGSFSSLKASYKYILSHKVRFPTVKLFHFSNLSLAKEFQTNYDYQLGIHIEKSTVIVEKFYETYVYKLEESFECKGWYYKDPSPNTDEVLMMIFGKRGITYYAPTYAFSSFTITKTLYNIANPPVTSSININSTYGCSSTTYYIAPESNCNLVFFIEYDTYVYTKNPLLVRYDECCKLKTRFPVDYFTEEVYSRLYVSTDKKYVIVIVNEWAGERHLIEIRPIATLDNIIYHQVFEFKRIQSRYYLDGFEMDFVGGNMILLKTPDFVFVTYADGRQSAKTYLREASI